MGRGTIDIDADPFVPYKGPPQHCQHHQLHRNSEGEVADKTVLGCLHAVMVIKMRATWAATKKSCSINGLQFLYCFGCPPARRAALPRWQQTAILAANTSCIAGEVAPNHLTSYIDVLICNRAYGLQSPRANVLAGAWS